MDVPGTCLVGPGHCVCPQIKFLRIRSEGGYSTLYCYINVIIITYYVGGHPRV